jgi:preprotein translocase subunit YajC
MQEIQLPLAALLPQVPDGSKLKSETTAAPTDGAAGDGAPAKEESTGMFGSPVMMLVLMGAFFWFVLIGPERKRRKKQEALLSGLTKGDEVVTNAGIYGKVVQIQDQVVTLQVADGVRMRFSLQAVQGLSQQAESDAKS